MLEPENKKRSAKKRPHLDQSEGMF